MNYGLLCKHISISVHGGDNFYVNGDNFGSGLGRAAVEDAMVLAHDGSFNLFLVQGLSGGGILLFLVSPEPGFLAVCKSKGATGESQISSGYATWGGDSVHVGVRRAQGGLRAETMVSRCRWQLWSGGRTCG